jgi:hypothetical protein
MTLTPEVLADSAFHKGDRRLLALSDPTGNVVPGLQDLAIEMNPSTDLRVLHGEEAATLLGVALTDLQASVSRYNQAMVRLWLDEAVGQ